MEENATEERLRWAAVATLLSLDRVRPFHAMMGVPAQDPDALVRRLRRAIVNENRLSALDQSHVADLRGSLLDAIAEIDGDQGAKTFDAWVANGFVHSPRDLMPADDWWQVLSLSRRRDDRWQGLGLPPGLSAEARRRLDAAASKTDLHALDDQATARKPSLWDAGTYARHGHDPETDDPYHRVSLTVLKRTMLTYLRWLASATTDAERAVLWDGAERMRRQIDATSGTDPLQDLDQVIRRHARHPA